MKKVEAIIKPFKLDEVKDALAEVGRAGHDGDRGEGLRPSARPDRGLQGRRVRGGLRPQGEDRGRGRRRAGRPGGGRDRERAQTGKIGDGKIFVAAGGRGRSASAPASAGARRSEARCAGQTRASHSRGRSGCRGRVCAGWWRCYVLAFPYHPGLRSPNELCRLWQTRALVEYGTLDLNQTLRDYGSVGDLSVKDGRVLPVEGAAAVLRGGAHLMRLLKKVGGRRRRGARGAAGVLRPAVPDGAADAADAARGVRRFLRAFVGAGGGADGVTATYALGSLAFSYSLLFMSHQTTAVLLFLELLRALAMPRGERRACG